MKKFIIVFISLVNAYVMAAPVIFTPYPVDFTPPPDYVAVGDEVTGFYHGYFYEGSALLSLDGLIAGSDDSVWDWFYGYDDTEFLSADGYPATTFDSAFLAAAGVTGTFDMLFRVYDNVDITKAKNYYEVVVTVDVFWNPAKGMLDSFASSPVSTSGTWQAIPEPAAALLMIVGGMLTWVVNRRKRLQFAL